MTFGFVSCGQFRTLLLNETSQSFGLEPNTLKARR